MQDNIKEQLKEEWRNQISKINDEGLAMLEISVADFWLSKIDELLKSQREILVEKIEKLDVFIITTSPNKMIKKEDIINLIKED